MAWKVFYSYSHKDTELREMLATYLAPLVRQEKIIEWSDRKIEPGGDWDLDIKEELDSAHLILLLISEAFLASDYCFGVEVERALTRLKHGEAKVVPVLLKPCLWQESLFSELQIIPRDAKPIISWASPEEAFTEVATEVRHLVSLEPPTSQQSASAARSSSRLEISLDLVRAQVRSYAHFYERTRQRMRPSHHRTQQMEEVFQKMRALASSSFLLLDELAESPSPGERLAAVAILQHFVAEKYLPLLVQLVGNEKPFVGYHATRALSFAVSAIEPRAYPRLREAIVDAKAALDSAAVGFDTDRQRVLRGAEQELASMMASLAMPFENEQDD